VTVADSQSAGPWQGLPSPLDAVDDMRTAAKWIIGAAAAVGVALLGGAPLTGAGKIHGFGSAAEAFGGLVLGLAGVGWAIWHTSDALIPPTTTLAALQQPELAELRAQIAADPPAFFGPFGTSVAQVQETCRYYDTVAAQAAVLLAAEPDPIRQRVLTQGQTDALANAAGASARLRWLLALAHAWRVRGQLRQARKHTFVGAAAAALGAVLFITATSTQTSSGDQKAANPAASAVIRSGFSTGPESIRPRPGPDLTRWLARNQAGRLPAHRPSGDQEPE
jgi:hypothetical protein